MKTLLWLARSYFSWYCFRKTARGALQDFLIFLNIHLGVVWWTSSIYPFTARVVGNWYRSEHSDKAPRNLGQQIQWAFFSEITYLSISIGIDLIQNIVRNSFLNCLSLLRWLHSPERYVRASHSPALALDLNTSKNIQIIFLASCSEIVP